MIRMYFIQGKSVTLTYKNTDMKKVIYINEQVDKDDKPVEFTHRLCEERGWKKCTLEPIDYEKVVYLGKCKYDGDMFAAYSVGHISIYKGHLNSGKY